MATSTIKGSPLETITIANNVNAYRKGNIVTVVWNNSAITSTTARTYYGTLPAGWKPPDAIFGVDINAFSGYGCVNSSGTVEGYRKSSGTILTYVTYVTA